MLTYIRAESSATVFHNANIGAAGNDSMGASIGVPKTTPAAMAASSQFETAPEMKERLRGGFFGLSKGRPTDKSLGQDGYEHKYPPDAYGEELGSDARIYKVYLDEATKFDNEAVDGWREHLDVLLVFAGLFSAVVTTFVAVSTDKLDTDWAETNAHLLAESNAIQRALAAGISLDNVPVSTMSPSTQFIPKNSDRWVNVLWFASLGLSLATALFATLAKQWLKHYRSNIGGSARDRARIVQSRRRFLELFKVPTIVGLLPILLHISLFMFFAGLAVFLHPLDEACFRTVIAILGVSLGVYVITGLFPVFHPLCPYVTPLTKFALAILQIPRVLVYQFKILIIGLKLDSVLAGNSSAFTDSAKETQFTFSGYFVDFWDLEKHFVGRFATSLDIELLTWLHSTASAVPTVTPLIIQAIAGLPIKCREFWSLKLIGAPVFQSYPDETEPWTVAIKHPDPQDCDPRGLYRDKDKVTVERYIRASVQFYAHCYNVYLITRLDARKQFPGYIEWRQGSLLFSLPCFADGWKRINEYADECEYIKNVCTTPWDKIPQPSVNKHGISRFVLIFTAFLRLQASASADIKLHPVLWEQLLIYAAEFLRLLLYRRNNSNTPELVYELTAEEEAFIRQSGKEILCRMLLDKEDISAPTFALRVDYPDMRNINEPTTPGTMVQQTKSSSDSLEQVKEHILILYSQYVQGGFGTSALMAQQQNTSDNMQKPTTLFQLPRRHYLLRFLFLSMMLGNSQKLVENWGQCFVFHLYSSTKLDFMYYFPDRYLISLIRLLDETSLDDIQRNNYAVRLASEIMSCVTHIKRFLTRPGPWKKKYADVGRTKGTTTQFNGDYLKAGYASASTWWRRHRPASYITAARYAFDRLTPLIFDDGDTITSHQGVRHKLVAALADCELCLRIIDPHGQDHTTLPVNKLVEYMLLIPTFEQQRPISTSAMWNENPIFDLLWRSLRSKNASFSEEFVNSDSMTAIIDGFKTVKAKTSWTDGEFDCCALPVAVVLLGFIQGYLERRGPASILTQLSSSPAFSILCSVLFPVFHAHPSYRIETDCKPVEYNHDTLWDTLIALTKKDVPLFKPQWENILQSETVLVNPEFKGDYERVEELKSLLNLNDPRYTQFVVMDRDEIPTDLKGEEEGLTPPQENKVQIDFCLIKSHLDDGMKLPSFEGSQSSSVQAETLAKEVASEIASFGALARLALMAKRRPRSASYELSQV